jgi:uridine kinase
MGAMAQDHSMNNLSLNQIIQTIASGERRNDFVRIVAIDGPAGSGKTTLASRIASTWADENVVTIHMDDLYDGWENALSERLTRTLVQSIALPASMGKSFSYRKYDWIQKRFEKTIECEVPDLLILEGVGSGQKGVRQYLDQLIWTETDSETGLQRVLRRDGDYLETEMRVWQMRESEHFQRDNTRDCATIRIDGKYFI